MDGFEKYKNIHGNSPILEFRIEDDSIYLKYKDGLQSSCYHYDNIKPGKCTLKK